MDEKELIDQLLNRGVENIIPSKGELKKRLESGEKLNVYLGIDPTATRIHLGHAFPLRKLQILSELGHKVKFLIGDFTVKVGDTSDKEGERPELSDEEIAENLKTYKEQAGKILDFSKVELVHNSEWLAKLTFAEVFDLMRKFSLNDFISRELIRKRLDDGKRVGLVETIYPLMQGYDSYHMDTDLQVGATDQTFNMQAGRMLQKSMRDKESFVLATGYLPGTDGRKMSKSWGNAIWLTDGPEEVYGKVMSLTDEVMEDYWLMATSLSTAEIGEKMKRVKEGENPMVVKRELAEEIVKELHGGAAVKKAVLHFDKTVVDKKAGDNVAEVRLEGMLDTTGLLVVLVEKRLVESKAQAKRLLDQGAIYVNDERLDDQLELKKGENLVRVGKRRYLKVIV